MSRISNPTKYFVVRLGRVHYLIRKLDKIAMNEVLIGYIVKIGNNKINDKTCGRHVSDFFIILDLPLFGSYIQNIKFSVNKW